MSPLHHRESPDEDPDRNWLQIQYTDSNNKPFAGLPFSIYHSQGPTYHGKLDAQGKTPCYKQLPDGHATVEVGQPRDLDQKIQSQRQQLKKKPASNHSKNPSAL